MKVPFFGTVCRLSELVGRARTAYAALPEHQRVEAPVALGLGALLLISACVPGPRHPASPPPPHVARQVAQLGR